MPSKLGGISSLLFTLLAGCFPGEETVDGMFTEEEFALVKTFELSPVGPPPNPTNKYADNELAAELGQKLFFEKTFSKGLTVPGSGLGNVGESQKVSCTSCHDPKAYFTDTRSRPAQTSLGVQWTNRNTPSLVNVTYYTWGSWGGKDDVPWNQGANGSESSQNFAGNRLHFARMIYAKYRDEYNALFPTPLPAELALGHDPGFKRFPYNGRPKSSSMAADGAWEKMTPEDRDAINTILANTGKAFEAYERKLNSYNAPIDRYIRGEHDALTAAQKRGLKLFIGKAACVDCHNGPTFTDQGFHNTGVPQVGVTATRSDSGRYDDLSRTLATPFNGAGAYSDAPEVGAAKLEGMELTDDLKGLFRTKSLRHIDKTAPYMHDGSLATLAEVVHFYNIGGGVTGYQGKKDAMMRPLALTAAEEEDLVEFLKSLTGEPVDEIYAEDLANPAKFIAPDAVAVCGNGFVEVLKVGGVDTLEACDDGNAIDGDGCSKTCVVECTDACP